MQRNPLSANEMLQELQHKAGYKQYTVCTVFSRSRISS